MCYTDDITGEIPHAESILTAGLADVVNRIQEPDLRTKSAVSRVWKRLVLALTSKTKSNFFVNCFSFSLVPCEKITSLRNSKWGHDDR